MNSDLDLHQIIKRGGGTSAVAQKCGVGVTVVSNWKKRGVPPERVLALEAATGVPRHQIRPDIYPPPSPDAEAAA